MEAVQDLGDLHLSAELRSILGQLHRRFRSERSEVVLGDAALNVLTRLEDRGPQTLSDLADYCHVAAASMHRTVEGLVACGFVVRARNQRDRRWVSISITPEGVRRAAEARAQCTAWLEERLASLRPVERSLVARAGGLLADIGDSPSLRA